MVSFIKIPPPQGLDPQRAFAGHRLEDILYNPPQQRGGEIEPGGGDMLYEDYTTMLFEDSIIMEYELSFLGPEMLFNNTSEVMLYNGNFAQMGFNEE